MDIKHVGSGTRYSRAVIFNQVAYLAGNVAKEPGPTAAEQARMIFPPGEQTNAILASIDKILEDSGTSKKRMLTASLFYADTRVVDEVNGRWDAWVPWHDPPACNFLITRLSGPRKRVAIQVTAAL